MIRRNRLIAAAVAFALLAGAVVWIRPASAAEQPTPARTSRRTLKVRVWERGGVAPTVTVDVPVVLVTVAIRLASATGLLDRALVSSCGEEERRSCVHLRGADLAALWSQITSAGPVRLVDVDGGDGSRVEVRID